VTSMLFLYACHDYMCRCVSTSSGRWCVRVQKCWSFRIQGRQDEQDTGNATARLIYDEAFFTLLQLIGELRYVSSFIVIVSVEVLC